MVSVFTKMSKSQLYRLNAARNGGREKSGLFSTFNRCRCDRKSWCNEEARVWSKRQLISASCQVG